MKNKKILLLWYQQDDNFGDILLYNTTKEHLETLGYCVEAHEVGDSEIKIAKHANQCGFMIFAGGGIVEKFVPPVIQNIKQLLCMLQVPYGVIGLGIGTFDYRRYAEMFSIWVNQAEFFFVRDTETRDYLNRVSNSIKVIFSGDVVFANRMFIRVACSGNGTGLNLRDIPYTDIQGDFNWNLLNKAISEAKCNILIPDCNNQIVHLLGTFDNLTDLENYKVLSPEKKIERVIWTIQKCSVIVAMRFHVVLVAALYGIIPIPILYCPKVRYLAEQLGIMELAIELGDWEKIPEKVELAKRNKDRFLKELRRNIIILRRNVQDMYKSIMDDLEKLSYDVEFQKTIKDEFERDANKV